MRFICHTQSPCLISGIYSSGKIAQALEIGNKKTPAQEMWEYERISSSYRFPNARVLTPEGISFVLRFVITEDIL